MNIDILIADDHTIMREGLKQILSACTDMRVAGEAGNGEEVLRMVRQQKWDIVVLDMSMPGPSGLELIKLIKAIKPTLPILVLSMQKEDQYAARTLKAGASGYLCKDSASSLLVTAIRKVAAGSIFLSHEAAENMALGALNKTSDAPPHNLLSNREYEIFERLIEGDSVTEIANRLNISVKTVSTHKTRIMQKLDRSTVADMVHYAIEHGIAKQP
jgi:two-component system, NarL family, invasion response regulator UvrY